MRASFSNENPLFESKVKLSHWTTTTTAVWRRTIFVNRKHSTV